MTGGRRDYYVVLGVARTEDRATIKDAFRELALRYHPDRAGARGTAFFQEIVEAYQVLSDPERRADYDRGLRAARREAAAAAPRVTPTADARAAEPLIPTRHIGGFEAHAPPFHELFDGFVSSFRVDESFAPARRPRILRMTLRLDPREALRGGQAAIAVPVLFPCPLCRGSGGSWSFVCDACHGVGMMEERLPLRLVIEPGVADGSTSRYPLRGVGLHDLELQVVIRVG